ncbi:hypothetical protein AM501_30935 [Aneurinibacillus migulanus]|uniref:hypothetical protein n=1 Tax=Aneurinibacillus migulanus TaxID=47500 RepID=UPI0005B88F25|nr:hypothetical protein [Aneurinibacillus migulanus]KIV49932.1 hypothetical protein TS64_29495 [Aneurinibacillus migulanus]KPD04584.1 hypothetical protein AM501_30935 [Aneurinibacillus migulanus]MCP1357134.1 hypothetical protein [Aneurinibacillus migulanus]
MIHKYVSILLLFSLSISTYPTISLSKNENNSNQQALQAFLTFEKQIYDLLDTAIEPLNELGEKPDMKNLYKNVWSAKQKFFDTSLAFTKLKIPPTLPDDIKASLKDIKDSFSTGFDALGASMGYFLQYTDNGNPILFDRFVEKREEGVAFIDGGLTSLASVKMQLSSIEFKLKPNAWIVGKRYLNELQNITPSGNRSIQSQSEGN